MSRHTRRVITWLPLLTAACTTQVELPTDRAELRLLHATPSLGPVDLQVGTATVIHGVGFGQASPLVLVPAGSQRLTVRSGTRLLGTLQEALSLSHVNTVVVADSQPQLTGVITPDTGRVASDRANLRLVNVVGSNTSPPTLLDVTVSADFDPDSVMTFGLDTKVASYGPLMYFPAGRFAFEFLPAGTAAVLTRVELDVALGQTRAVVLERDADGTYRAHVVEER